MRKIKFRAKAMSNKSTNWHYGLIRSIAKDGTGFLQDQRRNCVHINIETLGQYTGLKDKNGKEIYEGDVVGLSNGTSYKYKVVFSFGCFMARNKDGFCTNLYEIIDPEVIGNIYENSELLEQI